jgi:ArsR family transcriptional regulator
VVLHVRSHWPRPSQLLTGRANIAEGPTTLQEVSEPTQAAAIVRPLPVIDRARVATPHIIAEPRNLTVDVFRALADPIRLELLALIAAHGPVCVCHLEEALDYKQPRISKHLATLRKAGLVSSRREGTWVYYEVEGEMLEVATSFVEQVKESARTPRKADQCD